MLRLASGIVDSDISRVVVVPGNHDVNWDRAWRAMRPLDTCPPRINNDAFEANSRIRWNWSDQQAYEIFDDDMYLSRFQHFREFQTRFYRQLNQNPLSLDPQSDLVYFDYSDLGLAVAGFASWHGNDCLCPVGEINSASLALSQKKLASSTAPIALAVWHHGVAGGPRSIDYMDQRIIHKLIDLGFTVGLHGHHHYPAAAPFEIRLPNRTSMAVVGAGSLAVGNRELPMGESRQFNVVVIDPDRNKVTVHVRAMSDAGVFSKSPRADFGGESFIELDIPMSPARPKRPTDTQLLDDAMTAVTTQCYERALALLPSISCSHKREKRLIKANALDGLGWYNQLIELLDPPQSADEVVTAISLLLEAGRPSEARARLEAGSTLIDRGLYQDLNSTIAAREVDC